MDALNQSAELIRRGTELRARSVRMRTAADEKIAKSRRRLAVAAQIHQAVMHAYGWEWADPTAELFGRGN